MQGGGPGHWGFSSSRSMKGLCRNKEMFSWTPTQDAKQPGNKDIQEGAKTAGVEHFIVFSEFLHPGVGRRREVQVELKIVETKNGERKKEEKRRSETPTASRALHGEGKG